MVMFPWAELPRDRVRELLNSNATVAMAFGAIEQHGLHLPTGTDLIAAQHIIESAAQIATNNIVVLPPMPFGLSNYHMQWGGTISATAAALSVLLSDIASSVEAAGAKRFIIVNGHVGNRGIDVRYRDGVGSIQL